MEKTNLTPKVEVNLNGLVVEERLAKALAINSNKNRKPVFGYADLRKCQKQFKPRKSILNRIMHTTI
ncbi:hypothetical protein [Thermoflavifilum thermophilum]|uniref:Uncharacterized protein n=1 Tax=Thermoflavifilum thermophilum TaxID=1393122 RepID=A0A1I7NK84_9BACT|nr:hypothetical protein [Thermoflavifilum thermophilum]SFV35074.1 hypothetical protein SAMN05660895_2151 [Thermoflavifilum thermophilum]